jgi:chromosome segregation ATPase
MAADHSQDERPDKAAQAKPATRVDRAHARSSEIAPLVSERQADQVGPHDSPAIAVDDSPAATAAQVRLQASQLAAHLQRHQATIDHREAELNARVAAMENQIRAARLWLDERQGELTQRETALARQDATQADVPSRQTSSDRPSNHDELSVREAELNRRAAELDTAAAELARRFGTTDALGAAISPAESMETYRLKLVEAEQRLVDEQAEWQRRFRELSEQRAEFTGFVEMERQKLNQQRRQAAEARDAEQRDVKRQESDLANRTAALVGLRAEVQRTQQEALEMRLATEELWSQLSAQHAPESLAQSMAQIRLKLAEEFRLAKTELLKQRADIKQLAERLGQQHQKATEQRAQSQAWLNGRLQELEQYAGRIRTREQQVASERAALRAEQAQWQGEKFRLEQEIRRLTRTSPAGRNASAA